MINIAALLYLLRACRLLRHICQYGGRYTPSNSSGIDIYCRSEYDKAEVRGP
jgi:hypothetical protein